MREQTAADQHLCFHYTESTIPLIPKSGFYKPLTIFCGCTARFVSDLVGNPKDRFSHDTTNIFLSEAGRISIPSLPTTPAHKADVGPFQPFSETSTLDLDPFSASLQMSDEDRRYDAWIPSEETKNILITMATSPPGTYIPQSEQLCLPSLVVTESQVSFY